MAKKCVHKGCGKPYEDDTEACVYHPGPPIFHEGQKGWKCCKPRVLTFDEFLAIPPCTTGTHSDVDDAPAPEPVKTADVPNDTHVTLGSLQESLPAAPPRLPAAQAATPRPDAAKAPQPEESEDDEPDAQIKAGATCKRKGCGQAHAGGPRDADEKCVHHPGAPIFHEGSKGWSCCKRRVLEFDQFMNIEGCKTKARHLFVGKKKPQGGEEEKVDNVRHDFYQTATTLTLSLYLKKTLPPPRSTIAFHPSTLSLALHTADLKVYTTDIPLYADVDPAGCSFRVLGTKVEVTLKKAEGGRGWPVLGKDEKGASGEILQVGRAGRV